MVIEIKQLLIKSNVVDEEHDERAEQRNLQQANIKHEVLSECRRLIVEMLNDRGQR
ncbi:DUF5908 family protein [Cellvibrio sp. NN19]|uniref:DUF5908 family protein n=1 Tax=Cellvibrio chitinivorans TaxID=3102792 RepID=UPI002B414E3F|nr:DUF5908 family protein [Cellvibrio sp. NN19]